MLSMSGHPTAQTGGGDALPHWFQQPPVLEKPFTLRQLERALNFALREREQHDDAPRSGTGAHGVSPAGASPRAVGCVSRQPLV